MSDIIDEIEARERARWAEHKNAMVGGPLDGQVHESFMPREDYERWHAGRDSEFVVFGRYRYSLSAAEDRAAAAEGRPRKLYFVAATGEPQ